MKKLGCALTASLLLWARVAEAKPLPVVVQLEQDAPEIDGTELRDAAARELEAPVVSEEAQGVDAVRIVVRIDHARRELEVEREGTAGEGIVRRVPLPATPQETLRTAIFLIGNLARDEASGLIDDLQRPAAPEVLPQPLPPKATANPAPVAPAPRLERHRVWMGASVEGDLAFLPSSNDTCVLDPRTGSPLTTVGYQCVWGQSVFPPSQMVDRQIRLGEGDQVGGGLATANARFLVAVDAAISDHVLLGGRLGYATATFPEDTHAFGPLHIEGRVTYVIGERALATSGLFPVLALGAGLGEYSASVPVNVALAATFIPTAAPAGTLNVSAWRVAGPGFVSAGAGVRWAVTPDVALSVLPIKASFAFGNGPAALFLSPEITAQFGF
jgi:hypothetical protein